MKHHYVALAIGAVVGYAILGTNGAANAANIPLVGSLATSVYNLGAGFNSGNNNSGGGSGSATSSGTGQS